MGDIIAFPVKEQLRDGVVVDAIETIIDTIFQNCEDLAPEEAKRVLEGLMNYLDYYMFVIENTED